MLHNVGMLKNKDEVVGLRVSAKEKKAFRDAADREGLVLAAWMRQKLLLASGMLKAVKS